MFRIRIKISIRVRILIRIWNGIRIRSRIGKLLIEIKLFDYFLAHYLKPFL